VGNTTRVLEMSEDDLEPSESAFEDAELLVNETQLSKKAAGQRALIFANLAKGAAAAVVKAGGYKKFAAIYKKAKDAGDKAKVGDVGNVASATKGTGNLNGIGLCAGSGENAGRPFSSKKGWTKALAVRTFPYIFVERRAGSYDHDDGNTLWVALGHCVGWKWEIGKKIFDFEIGWSFFSRYPAMWMSYEVCINILEIFSIPPPLYATFCASGNIQISFSIVCPEIGHFNMKGGCYWTLSAGIDLWIFKIDLIKLQFGIEAGMAERKFRSTKCWWVSGEGRRRRRWWTRRRRNAKKCNYYWSCDIYIKAYVRLELCVWMAKLEVAYWILDNCIEIQWLIYGWSWYYKDWQRDYDTMLWKYHFGFDGD